MDAILTHFANLVLFVIFRSWSGAGKTCIYSVGHYGGEPVRSSPHHLLMLVPRMLMDPPECLCMRTTKQL